MAILRAKSLACLLQKLSACREKNGEVFVN